MNAQIPLPKKQTAAFTLIELLTVIAIIAILMGLLFPALSGAKKQARRADAGVGVRNIVNACKNYYNDYGKFPPVTGALDGTKSYLSFGDISAGGCAVTNDQLFDILRANDKGASSVNASHALNKRQVKYFEMGKAKDPKNPRSGFVDGNEFSGTKGQLMDPWGAQYCIVLDAADAGSLDLSKFYTDIKDVVRVSAASFSMGEDNKRGGKGYEKQFRKPNSSEAPDDIVSWQ